MSGSTNSNVPWGPQPGSVRIARPTASIEKAMSFYVDGVGWTRHGGFRNHEGIDGEFVGAPDVDWHLELTFHEGGPTPRPTDEDLFVLYLTTTQCNEIAQRLVNLGHANFQHPNPYWQSVGARCFHDPDGYVLVLSPL